MSLSPTNSSQNNCGFTNCRYNRIRRILKCTGTHLGGRQLKKCYAVVVKLGRNFQLANWKQITQRIFEWEDFVRYIRSTSIQCPCNQTQWVCLGPLCKNVTFESAESWTNHTESWPRTPTVELQTTTSYFTTEEMTSTVVDALTSPPRSTRLGRKMRVTTMKKTGTIVPTATKPPPPTTVTEITPKLATKKKRKLTLATSVVSTAKASKMTSPSPHTTTGITTTTKRRAIRITRRTTGWPAPILMQFPR